MVIGTQQSPIDLRNPIQAELAPLQLHWKLGLVEVADDCQTILFCDNGYMLIGDVTYTLTKAHIHRPSEHVVNDRKFGMEIHLVHEAGGNRLSVVGIFVEPGEVSDVFLELLSCGRKQFDPNTLLPAERNRQYDRYEGSLTTPPYSENVTWSVLSTPITAAQNQLDLVPEHAREVQQENRRYVLRGG